MSGKQKLHTLINELHISTATILSDDGNTKTFNKYGDVPVRSPIGALCTLTEITTTIFRASHADGGYDCYMTMFYAVKGGAGYTDPKWVGLKPPGGLPLTLVPVTDGGGFLNGQNLPSVPVQCGGAGPNLLQVKVDPDLFGQTATIAIMILSQTSWERCH